MFSQELRNMTQLTTQQKFIIDKKRQETSYLWRHPEVWEVIYAMGKQGKSDNEIIYDIYNNWTDDLLEYSPESVAAYLNERWLSKQVRKAIKFVPVVNEANWFISNIARDEEVKPEVRLKAAMWIADKYDMDTEAKGEKGNTTNNIFQMNGVTNIIVE